MPAWRDGRFRSTSEALCYTGFVAAVDGGQETYIVAVRRDRRDAVPKNWVARLRSLEGVSVVGATATRAQIEIPPTTLSRVRDEIGDSFQIEPVIRHFPI